MTGRRLVEQLLGKNYKVRIIVRSSHKLPADIVENPNTMTIEASVLDLTDEEVTEHVMDCDAVVSCLGHVINFKGIFGEPKKLCTGCYTKFMQLTRKAQPSQTHQIHSNEYSLCPKS